MKRTDLNLFVIFVNLTFVSSVYQKNTREVNDNKNPNAEMRLAKFKDGKGKSIRGDGKLTLTEVDEVKSVIDDINNLLNGLQRSELVGHPEWYDQIYQWIEDLNVILQSRQADKLLESMIFPMKYAREYYGRTDVSKRVLKILYSMHYLGPAITRVLADKITQGKGYLEPKLREFALEFFADDGFHDLKFWSEDEFPPLTRPGLFIAIFENGDLKDDGLIEKLAAITYSVEVHKYFASYMENGEGITVLKNKFGEHRSEIESLYKRVEERKKAKMNAVER